MNDAGHGGALKGGSSVTPFKQWVGGRGCAARNAPQPAMKCTVSLSSCARFLGLTDQAKD